MAQYEEEIEIVHRKDGTTSIKVVTSKRACLDVTKPFEDGRGGGATSRTELPNPGQQNQQHLKGTS